MNVFNIKRDTRAASPVVGTILLVAITLLVVSTVSVVVFGFGFTDTICNAGLPTKLKPITDPIC